jgi:hypothetical protein
MTYRTVTVTLENIGGIVAQKDRSGFRTVRLSFNATIAGKRQYAIAMSGHPRLENGMAVTAVLRDTENWQTLLGWRDHGTGEICGVDSPGMPLFLCVFGLLVSVLYSLKMLSEATSTGGLIFWFLAIVPLNVWLIFSWRRSATAYRLLQP